MIAPTDPLKVDLAFFRKPPSPAHCSGTDSAGRDVLSRLIYAGQVSLTVGLVAALMSSGIGLVLGSIAGTYGGWVDTLIMRLTDVVLSFPALVVIITLVALVGPSMLTIMLGHRPVLLADGVPHGARRWRCRCASRTSSWPRGRWARRADT